jgi:hypothetical protein
MVSLDDAGMKLSQRDRFQEALLGLAAGDAVGTTVEFEARGSFAPVTDMTGGGPFGLQPGEWTDDTSRALCLGQSRLDQHGFDPVDQLEKYVRWWREGYLRSWPRLMRSRRGRGAERRGVEVNAPHDAAKLVQRPHPGALRGTGAFVKALPSMTAITTRNSSSVKAPGHARWSLPGAGRRMNLQGKSSRR